MARAGRLGDLVPVINAPPLFLLHLSLGLWKVIAQHIIL